MGAQSTPHAPCIISGVFGMFFGAWGQYMDSYIFRDRSVRAKDLKGLLVIWFAVHKACMWSVWFCVRVSCWRLVLTDWEGIKETMSKRIWLNGTELYLELVAVTKHLWLCFGTLTVTLIVWACRDLICAGLLLTWIGVSWSSIWTLYARKEPLYPLWWRRFGYWHLMVEGCTSLEEGVLTLLTCRNAQCRVTLGSGMHYIPGRSFI